MSPASVCERVSVCLSVSLYKAVKKDLNGDLSNHDSGGEKKSNGKIHQQRQSLSFMPADNKVLPVNQNVCVRIWFS